MKIILIILLLFAGSFASAQKGKTIMAIFPHPDDEQSVAPVLAKYAAAGANIYLVVVTDGRLGVEKHAGIPAGDSLAAVRKSEIICAAKAMGIHPPILLGFHDQLGLEKGMGGLYVSMDSLRKLVTRLFDQYKPDVILTLGPSGWTGHPDHRLVGNIVTEVFETRQWDWHPALYYPELATGSLPADAPHFATVDPAYLTVRVALSAGDLAKAKAALLCHRSQYLPETVEWIERSIWTREQPVAYFRPFAGDTGMHHSLFGN
jgi:LmbE family N-acetylglucosaminyl deacetylase